MSVKRVTVGGVTFDALTEDRVVDHVRAALGRGQGGRILTPNVDVLRQIGRNDDARDALDDSTLVIADGMPVVWASRLAGTPLPQRVSGADLIWSLSRGLARDGRSVFVFGGQPAENQLAATERRPMWPNELTPAPDSRATAPSGRHAANAYHERDPGSRNSGPAHHADPGPVTRRHRSSGGRPTARAGPPPRCWSSARA
jgi:hypothetical protein